MSAGSVAHRLGLPWHDGPLAPFLAVTATLWLWVAVGHDGRKIGQLLLLALPGLLWMWWPLRSAAMRTVRSVALWLWAMAFVADATLRAYLFDTYQAAPDSSLVLGAMANTSARESAEYLAMHWRSVTATLVPVAVAGGLLAWFVWPSPTHHDTEATRSRRAPWGIALLALALLASSVAYASKPWRRLHPVLHWADWSRSVQDQRALWADGATARLGALERARAAQPVLLSEDPATVVLVVSESINRDNLGLYGYARATTPKLSAQHVALAERLIVLRNAWSADPATLPALANLFQFGDASNKTPMHVLALARAAGYRVWWIGNQDDMAVEQTHAAFADELHLINRTPGRSSASPDSDVLPHLRAALADPHPRKLVVLHLMGAHPHYHLRYPEGRNPFEGKADAVERQLESQGRPGWLRQLRNEYDAALLNHDLLVSELLDLARAGGAGSGYRAWMFLSDHGQEVAHERDHAGHSPGTAAGYRIPALIWQSEAHRALPAGLERRPFRADWSSWTLADLLRIRWHADEPSRNVLNSEYQWLAPSLGVPVASFVD
ncbi:MAG: phosphoethanolamine transferase [Telluria sp.]|nr:phosphoethanolamine transferase [Telluria sp.]